jgi:hypothetical protein
MFLLLSCVKMEANNKLPEPLVSNQTYRFTTQSHVKYLHPLTIYIYIYIYLFIYPFKFHVPLHIEFLSHTFSFLKLLKIEFPLSNT